MAWWEVRHKYRYFLKRDAQVTVAEFFKIPLALTGLPRIYRKLDRWRRRHHKPHLNDLDTLTQEAVRLFLSHLDATSLPPMERAVLYGSRARGDHRHDSDVDIMLVFAGAMPKYDKQSEVCNALSDAQYQANTALQSKAEVTSFANWQDQFDAPDKQCNPDFYRNVLADGVDVTFLYDSSLGNS